jgi:hypothetical protein
VREHLPTPGRAMKRGRAKATCPTSAVHRPASEVFQKPPFTGVPASCGRRCIGTVIGNFALTHGSKEGPMPDHEMNLDKEAAHLARFEQMLADRERTVDQQMLRIERLRADGHNTSQAEQFLAKRQETLEEWRHPRGDISAIEQIEDRKAERKSGNIALPIQVARVQSPSDMSGGRSWNAFDSR